MTGLVRKPLYFTHKEWVQSNNLNYRAAEKEREYSQGLQNECDRFIQESEKRTDRTLKDVNKKIDQRIKDIKFWKSEINKKLEDVATETDALNHSFIRLKKALEATDEPLHLSQQCILTREGRTNIDLVHDNAQKELYKETEVIRGVQALLQKTLEQAKEQLRLNRKATYKLKNDASDKLQAQNIDEYALSLKSTDESLPGLHDSLGVDPQSVNTEEWQNFSVDNIELGDRVLQNSQDLRSLIDGILQQVASDQRRQIEATNLALQKRIEETRSAKGKLEEHLAEVLKEISKMEDMIVEINKAIQDKEGALRLAGTRIDLRKQRPNIELCRDAAEYKLLQEVDEITRDVDALQQRLKMSHESLKGLCRRQLELEEEIQIKAATLFIDEVQCKGIRETLKIAAF